MASEQHGQPTPSPVTQTPNPLMVRAPSHSISVHSGDSRPPMPAHAYGMSTRALHRTSTVSGAGEVELAVSSRRQSVVSHGRGPSLARGVSVRGRADTLRPRGDTLTSKDLLPMARPQRADTTAVIAELTGTQNLLGDAAGPGDRSSVIARLGARGDAEMFGFPSLPAVDAETMATSAAAANARLRTETLLAPELATILNSGAVVSTSAALRHRETSLYPGAPLVAAVTPSALSTVATAGPPEAVVPPLPLGHPRFGAEASIPERVHTVVSMTSEAAQRSGDAALLSPTATPAVPAEGAGAGPLSPGSPPPGRQLLLHDYVASRTGGREKLREAAWPWWYRCYRRGLTRFILTGRMLLTMTLIGLGILFEFAFPDQSFYENPVYKWMYLFGGTLVVIYPLEFIVWVAYTIVRWMSRLVPFAWVDEVLLVASTMKRHVPHLGAVICALLLKTIIFRLDFSDEGEFYFVATCASLIFIKGAMMVRNVALQVLLRALYRQRHQKPVADALWYSEIILRVSNPHALVSEEAAQETTVPTNLLENESFWTQADHLRKGGMTAYDAFGNQIALDSAEKLATVATQSFDRLYEHAIRQRRLDIKTAIVDYIREDVQDVEFAKQCRAAARKLRALHESGGSSQTLNTVGKRMLPKFLRSHKPRERSSLHENQPAAPGAKLRRTHSAGSLAKLNTTDPSAAFAKLLDASRRNAEARGTATAAGQLADESKAMPAGVPLEPGLRSPANHLSFDPYYCQVPKSPNDIPDNPDVSRWIPLVKHITELTEKYGIRPDFYLSHSPDDVPHEEDAEPGEFPPTAHIIEEVVILEQQLADMAAASKASLTLEGIKPCFASSTDALAAFRLFDLDGDGVVTRDEFVGGCTTMFNAWNSAKGSTQTYGGISGAIQILANIIYWIVLVLVILAIFRVNLNQVLVPLTTTMIAFGFAIGPTVQRLIDSLLFVMVIAPFDVGDKVSISTIQAGATLTVLKVYLLYTEFQDGFNKRIISRNADLIAQNIVNLRRSGEMAITTKFWIVSTVDSSALAALKRGVEAFVTSRPVAWKPAVSMSVVPGDSNRLDLSFSVTHRSTWQDPGKSSMDSMELNLEICKLMKDARIRYTLPAQPVIFTQPGYAPSFDAGAKTDGVPQADAALDKLVEFGGADDAPLGRP